MPCCCVPNCRTRGGMRMHQFPTDYERRVKWMKAVKREDLLDIDWKKVRMSYRVCALHFSDDHKFEDFENLSNLKKSAYPTLLLPDEQTMLVKGNTPERGQLSKRRKAKLSLDKCGQVVIKSPQVKDEYVNFEDVCRLCLSSQNDLTSINQLSFGSLSVQDVFEQYFAIKMDLLDDLPQHICTMCLYELCRVYLFINNCREADAKLKELILNVENKVYEDTVITESPETESDDFVNQTGPLKVTEPGPPFACGNCPESYDTLAEIKDHRTLLKHYTVRQYLCRFCNPSKLYTYRHWKNHVRVHTGEKPYGCQVCGKKFSGRSNRERHVLTHTGVKPYSCNLCGKAYTQPTNLKHHKLREHSNLEAETIKGQFECTDCEKVFSSRASLSHHVVVHYDKKFLCSECGKSFHYKSQFDRHTDSHDGFRRYNCDMCDKAFAKSISLRLHKCTHTGHKPHECEYCQKRFSQKAHLVNHMRTHTGERPYSCPYCYKAFALNGNLTVHVRKHTGDYPYVCDICSRGFADSSNLKKHRKKHLLNML